MSLDNYWAEVSEGVRNGELIVLKARRSTGKTLLGKYMLNSKYGKMNMVLAEKVTITKAYKGEWKVEVPYPIYKEVEQWLHDTLGTPGNNRIYAWRKSYSLRLTYFLRKESDLLMFRLRWEH